MTLPSAGVPAYQPRGSATVTPVFPILVGAALSSRWGAAAPRSPPLPENGCDNRDDGGEAAQQPHRVSDARPAQPSVAAIFVRHCAPLLGDPL
jgi:hypothetical protein